ncbi:MAG: hypothetical protein NTV97_24570 [Alphaproteobacteria bacterium]|nr:hypothetical protein [Alphaproteobacteria bacterium]
MVQTRICRSLVALLMAVSLAACGSASSGAGASAGLPRGEAGDKGRAISIEQLDTGGGTAGNAPMTGGLMGGLLGNILGSIIGGGHGGGGLIGMALGAIGGAIVGTVIEKSGGGPKVEVTVQKEDGQQVVVTQSDDGTIELGDRVQIISDGTGVKAVPDTTAPSE